MARTRTDKKIVQYLAEAHAAETTLTRVLEAQVAMTPRGDYRQALETHLKETRDHARRLRERLKELGSNVGPAALVYGTAQVVTGQVLAVSKTPLDLARGTSGAEKVLKNARDAAATEALEIATYTSLERVAKQAGDDKTARLAASIRAEEERMYDRVLKLIPRLTDLAADSGRTFDPRQTGAADALRDVIRRAEGVARRVPGVARAEGTAKGSVATAASLPIARYDDLTVDEIASRVKRLDEVDVAKVHAYERAHKNRAGVLEATKRELTTA